MVHGPIGYEILSELGRGSRGVVYKAWQKELNRTVALKIIEFGSNINRAALMRFSTEVEAMARLLHPHIVQIHEVGSCQTANVNHVVYLSFEYCAGGSLERQLAGNPLPPMESAELVETLARAVQSAHEKGVLHLDLTPRTVLIAEDGTPKITGFGVRVDSESGSREPSEPVTGSSTATGTLSYMAPEQASGPNKAIGPASDIYALGAILYECLTGRPPFKAATAKDTLEQVLHDLPAPVTQLNSQVPRDLEIICLKCLEKAPSRRYASAAALAEDLRRFQWGESTKARPVRRIEQMLTWTRRRPAAAALLGISALAAALLVSFGVYSVVRLARERNVVVQERDRAENLLYASQLQLAQAAWNENNFRLAMQHLDSTTRDFRGWAT